MASYQESKEATHKKIQESISYLRNQGFEPVPGILGVFVRDVAAGREVAKIRTCHTSGRVALSIKTEFPWMKGGAK